MPRAATTAPALASPSAARSSTASAAAYGSSPRRARARPSASRSKFRKRKSKMSALTIEARGRPAELLLVEDNYGDVLLVREAFRSAKIRNNLSVAGDGEEALSILRREGVHGAAPTPDLILLDLNLPRMD